MKLIIGHKFPSLNEYIAAMNRNRHIGNRMKQDCTDMVALSCLANKMPKFKKIKLHCKWIEKTRRRDPDNLCFNQKFILDGLVRAGVIPNDGWKNVSSIEHTWVIGKVYAVEIEIEEAA